MRRDLFIVFVRCAILCRKILGSYGKVTQTVFTELNVNRELKQPRRRRQQKPHKFAYLTMKNSIFARFARAFFIF